MLYVRNEELHFYAERSGYDVMSYYANNPKWLLKKDEFKYLKKDEKNKLEEVTKEATEQIKQYGEFEEIKKIKDLNKYVVVAVNDELFVKKIV